LRWNPVDFKIIGIKGPNSFKPNFREITAASLTIDMLGTSSANLLPLPWNSVRGPISPPG
jgi:microcystin degradation protein MlrC